MTSHSCVDMSEQYAVTKLPNDAWLQQDGSPPHCGYTVCEFLDECFSNKWIGWGNALAWPPRSPGIISLDFFLWGYIKILSTKREFQTFRLLWHHIIQANATVTNAMLKNRWQEIKYCLSVCKTMNGAHIEIWWMLPTHEKIVAIYAVEQSDCFVFVINIFLYVNCFCI